MSQLIVQIYKLSHTALKTKTRVVKVNHNLLHIVLQVNQNVSLECVVVCFFLFGLIFFKPV